MDTSQLKTHIFDYDAFPEMSEEEHELWIEDMRAIEDFTEFTAYLGRIGVMVFPHDPRVLTDFLPGKYDSIH